MSKSKKKVFHLVCNAHLDPVWLWPWEEGMTEAIATFRVAADFCEKYAHAKFVFCHNEALLYHWVEKHDPKLFARIAKLVKKGSWVITGGAWLQPDVNGPSGESHIRQFLHGLDYFADRFGKRPRTAYNFDPFGHPMGFPQVLAGCGIENYTFCRPDHGTYDLPVGAFIWQDRDGSSVWARRSDEHYLSRPSSGQSAAEKFAKFVEHYEAEPASMLLWGLGNHGGGPSRKDYEDLMEEAAKHSHIKAIHSDPDSFYDDLKAKGFEPPLRETEIQNSFLGCYTSMSRVKRGHRVVENLALSVEKLSALAWWFKGETYPDELHDAWKDVLFSEFHDILPGSCIPPCEQDSVGLLGGAEDKLRRIRVSTLVKLLNNEPRTTDGNTSIFVTNPHSHTVDRVIDVEFNAGYDLVEDIRFDVYRGKKKVPSQSGKPHHNILSQIERETVHLTLKPYEIARLDLRITGTKPRPTQAKRKLTAKDLTFKSDKATYQINPNTGLIDAIKIKGQSQSLVTKGAFAPVIFDDISHAWTCGDRNAHDTPMPFSTATPWTKPSETFKLANKQQASTLSPAGTDDWQITKDRDFVRRDKPQATALPIQIIEQGPIRTIVEAIFVCGPSAIARHYIYDKPTGLMTIRDRVLMNHKDAMLKVSVPLSYQPKGTISESGFSVALREPDKKHVDHHNHRWIAAVGENDGPSLGIANTGSFAHSLKGKQLMLNVVRTPAYSSFGLNPNHEWTAHRFLPRMDQGEHEVTYALLPQAAFSETEIHRLGLEINAQPYAMTFFPGGKRKGELPASADTPSVSVKPSQVEITTIKKALREDALIIRLRNMSGKRTKSTVHLGDDKLDPVTLEPFAVVSVKVEKQKKSIKQSIVNHVEGL